MVGSGPLSESQIGFASSVFALVSALDRAGGGGGQADPASVLTRKGLVQVSQNLSFLECPLSWDTDLTTVYPPLSAGSRGGFRPLCGDGCRG